MGKKGKKILITGAGGFIGSHLLEMCVEQGYHVKALVRYNSKNDWGWLEHVACRENIEVISGDVRDYDLVYNALKGCDEVFHLAALIGIPYSYVSPLAYFRTNVEGTYNILEVARHLRMEKVIITSTSETYGTAQYVSINEHHPLVGQSPYSASKIGADQLALSYFYSFGLPVKIVRPFNAYGPRQSARAIMPTVIAQILSGSEQIKLGNLHPTRDLTFVKDTAQGIIKVSQSKQLVGEVTNIGTNSEISIGDLVNLIASLLKTKVEVISDCKRVRPRGSEVERLRCDNSKLKKFTSWEPIYDLEKGLKVTISWMKENFHLYKPDMYNV